MNKEIGNVEIQELLTIRQQNLNKSMIATQSMINTVSPNSTDIIAIQEPYLDFLKRTRATRAWSTVYPTKHNKDGEERSRAILLVNAKIKVWQQIQVNSPDIVAIKGNNRYRRDIDCQYIQRHRTLYSS